MTFKIDMSKAYGMVEWAFLKAMMEKIGFRKAIMKCLNNLLLNQFK